MILGVKWSSCVHQNPKLSQISSEEQRENEVQRAQENRLKRGHSQREADHKGSEKEEEVSRVLPGFSLTLRPRKIQNFFSQTSFDTCFSL